MTVVRYGCPPPNNGQLSIIPFDVFGLVINSSDVSKFRVLRVVRLMRLVKLVRMFKSAR